MHGQEVGIYCCLSEKAAIDIVTAGFTARVGGSLWLSSHRFGAAFERGGLNY